LKGRCDVIHENHKTNIRNESNDKIYETQIDEKNKQIDTLRKDVIRLENDIRKSETEYKREIGAAKLDFQTTIRN
jgi:hypothetical protein